MLWLVLAAVLCAVYRRWGTFFLTVAAVALADMVTLALKLLVDRPRPFIRYAQPKVLVPIPHDPSFPSGHSATSFAAATMLSWAFPGFAPVLLLLAAAVAYSRVYVGVHYPIDIVAGAALGAVVATALRLLVTARRRLRQETQSG
jgi:undecaprenyl-diphosphatase